MSEIKHIMEMMCEEIGVDSSTMDFKESEWYLKHTWTEEQENSFKNKLLRYLMNSKKAREGFLEHPEGYNRMILDIAVNSFVMQYGWKTE